MIQTIILNYWQYLSYILAANRIFLLQLFIIILTWARLSKLQKKKKKNTFNNLHNLNKFESYDSTWIKLPVNWR